MRAHRCEPKISFWGLNQAYKIRDFSWEKSLVADYFFDTLSTIKKKMRHSYL